MKKQLLTIIGILALSFTLISWGSGGHFKINTNSSLSFNQEMSQFNAWTSILAEHASDADIRKATDPTEAPKHYIDIDSYPEFITSGIIPQTLDSVILAHGYSFVYDAGILPWATLTTFDSLTHCFQRLDWEKASLFASDLGHYVGDGYMPLHITNNYNGQLTGNYGIHSRYETAMVNAYLSQIIYSGDTIEHISNVNQYVFNYLYINYQYVDSVIAADNYAKTISSNTSSFEYKQALWNKTHVFTINLFKGASNSLAKLIYTAWVNAGSPLINPSFINYNFQLNSNTLLKQNWPNPIQYNTNIEFTVPESSNVILEVKDLRGLTVVTIFEGFKLQGNYSFEWKPYDIHAGIYYLVMSQKKRKEVKKIIIQ